MTRRDDTPPGGWLGPGTTGWDDLPEIDPPAQHREATAHAIGTNGKDWRWKPGPSPRAIDKRRKP